MYNIVTDRFVECHNYLKEEGIVKSTRQFAVSLGYAPQSMSEIIKQRRDVPLEILRKAIEIFDLNPLYLFSGKGKFLAELSKPELKTIAIVTDNEQKEKIVHIPYPAQAGYASENSDQIMLAGLPAYSLPDYQYQTGTYRSFDIRGDSMEPTLRKGDKLVCSFVEQQYWDHSIKDNRVYILVTQGNILVKRVVNLISKSGKLLLKSDNPAFESYTIPASELKEVWLAQTLISEFDHDTPTNLNHHKRLNDQYEQSQELLQQLSVLINNK